MRLAAEQRFARQPLFSEPQIQRWRPVLWGRTFHASRRSWKESSHPIDSSWLGTPARLIAGTLGGTGIPHRVPWLGRSVPTKAAGIPWLPNGESHLTQEAATPATGLYRLFLCFCFLGEVSSDPLLLLPEFGGSPSCPSFRVLARRNPHHTNRQTTTRPAAWQPTTKAPAPTPTTGARREKRETLGCAVAGLPRSRRARATLAHPSRAASHSGGRRCRPSRWQGCTGEHAQPFWWHGQFTRAGTRLGPLPIAH